MRSLQVGQKRGSPGNSKEPVNAPHSASEGLFQSTIYHKWSQAYNPASSPISARNFRKSGSGVPTIL